MAFRRIPVSVARRFFIKRRFTFGVVFASVPFLGYLLIFGRSISVPGKVLSTNIDCSWATKQRKVEHSTGSLNTHMWYGICGTKVDILRNWPHFPYLPDKRSFVSEFRKTQVFDARDNGERFLDLSIRR